MELPNLMWDIVILHLSPTTIFSLMRTCKSIRKSIDDNGIYCYFKVPIFLFYNNVNK